MEPELLDKLESLLETLLTYSKAFSLPPQACATIQSTLKDYSSAHQLITLITACFQQFMQQLLSHQESSPSLPHQHEKLQRLLQAKEEEIRLRARNEQSGKLVIEQLNNRLREAEEDRDKLLEQTKRIMVNLKRENYRLIEENRKLLAAPMTGMITELLSSKEPQRLKPQPSKRPSATKLDRLNSRVSSSKKTPKK